MSSTFAGRPRPAAGRGRMRARTRLSGCSSRISSRSSSASHSTPNQAPGSERSPRSGWLAARWARQNSCSRARRDRPRGSSMARVIPCRATASAISVAGRPWWPGRWCASTRMPIPRSTCTASSSRRASGNRASSASGSPCSMIRATASQSEISWIRRARGSGRVRVSSAARSSAWMLPSPGPRETSWDHREPSVATPPRVASSPSRQVASETTTRVPPQSRSPAKPAAGPFGAAGVRGALSARCSR